MLKHTSPEIPMIFLKPGEVFMSAEPAVVMTVLGSCIAVTMFNQRLGLGAICHCILPRCTCKDNCNDDCTRCIFEAGCRGICRSTFKYVDCSIKNLVLLFAQQGALPGEIEVKLFGGGDMFSSAKLSPRSPTVGTQNIKTAMRILEMERLQLSTSDTGGPRGRKIVFDAKNGRVLMKRVGKAGALNEYRA